MITKKLGKLPSFKFYRLLFTISIRSFSDTKFASGLGYLRHLMKKAITRPRNHAPKKDHSPKDDNLSGNNHSETLNTHIKNSVIFKNSVIIKSW